MHECHLEHNRLNIHPTTLDIKASKLNDQFVNLHATQQKIFLKQYSILKDTIAELNKFLDNRYRGATFIFTKYKTLKQKVVELFAR